MSSITLKSALKRKKNVQFCKIVHKKNITPLPDKRKGEKRIEGCFDGGDPALSFAELTDQSVQGITKKETPPRKISSFVVEIRKGRRRSNLYHAMSGSVKSFFSRKTNKRSAPSLPDDGDSEVLFVDEVINSKKTTSSIHSSQDRIVTDASHSTSEEEPIVVNQVVTRPTPKLWVDEFAPKKEEDIIHGPSLDIFKDWLRSWKKHLTKLAKAENEPPKKRRKSYKNYDSDYEPEADTEGLCSTFVLSGPTGCGKTSFVHFLAKEFGFNVIELSASDVRTGKYMKDRLQGAMENFGVRRPGDIRSMFGAQNPKKNSLKYNLVLIDDADIVFKSDTGYWASLGEFSVESKSPIVLTCTNRNLVVCHMENSEYEGEHFIKREKQNIVRHLKEWIDVYAKVTFDKDIVNAVVQQSKQDIRKAVNNLQFNGGHLSVNEENVFPKFSLSSQSLAELDCILTKCNEFERNSKIRWNARILSNINYVPDKSPLRTYDIPSVDNNNENFIRDLSNLFSSSLPSSFQDFDKMDQRLSTNLQSRYEVSAPILPAVYDAYKRCDPGSTPRICALYELPLLASIHQGWSDRLKGKPSQRRVIHPFNLVVPELGKALDRLGNLEKTINEYCKWSK